MCPALAAHQAGYDDAPSLARETAVGILGLLVLGLVGYGATLGFHISNLHNGLHALAFAGSGSTCSAPDRATASVSCSWARGGGGGDVLRPPVRPDSPSLPGAEWLAWVRSGWCRW